MRGEGGGAPSKETELPETVKSTPVWRIAFPHVSPSMPTHADAACEPDAPEGSLGVGTVNVAVTLLYVPCAGRQHAAKSSK